MPIELMKKAEVRLTLQIAGLKKPAEKREREDLVSVRGHLRIAIKLWENHAPTTHPQTQG